MNLENHFIFSVLLQPFGWSFWLLIRPDHLDLFHILACVVMVQKDLKQIQPSVRVYSADQNDMIAPVLQMYSDQWSDNAIAVDQSHHEFLSAWNNLYKPHISIVPTHWSQISFCSWEGFYVPYGDSIVYSICCIEISRQWSGGITGRNAQQ